VTASEPVEVYRSYWRPASEERGFVLHAVGIESVVVRVGATWVLYVPAESTDAALVQLRRYELENPPRRRPAAPEPLHRHAWVGSAAYAFVMLLVGYLAGEFAYGVDWLAAGALRGAPTQAGEWWRAVTALTLHLDVGHLLANLGFGTVFGLLAGQLLGTGVAWATVLAAAAGANFVNAFLQPANHSSVGASTAVFATATGSVDHASAVGPFSSGLTPSKRVPSRARVARRFFATLYVAPAARIRRRSSLTSATVRPLFWATSTKEVSAKTVASEATNSRFSVRSTPRLRRWPGPSGRAPAGSHGGEGHLPHTPVRLSGRNTKSSQAAPARGPVETSAHRLSPAWLSPDQGPRGPQEVSDRFRTQGLGPCPARPAP